MTDPTPQSPPCIVDMGTVIHKRDMYRLLADLGRVRYLDICDGRVQRQGEGYIMEVYKDPRSATMVVNRSLYLNIHSFDCLTIETGPTLDPTGRPQVTLDLIQENRTLRLIPLSDPLSDPEETLEDARALKAAVADALASGWDPVVVDEEQDLD